ncbi:pseudouridine synthase [Rubellimicrobium thermophilum DSM 16684]|uniref:Pseudouridine synthase n=1 Tax=Rubellimicrobium thermophilum DSM 16684 TaxID=1123069 RepID=S9R5P2_9RHOB|nr:pseudouridine synthase [Rubellimicrobium thermophilum]EPX87308.1 pseudouridine synthase [Rubellimicrobium thermophilum DSM 16684]
MSTDDDSPAEPARPLPAPEEGERIAKALARAGVASRRDAERMVIAGRVSVNGTIVTSPAINVRPEDRLAVDGVDVPPPEAVRLWLYHKPAGLVTTEKDEEGRPTVFDSLPEDMPRVMSIGRLDLTSEGLLLLTNDGEVKRKLELPATGWTRRYRVRVHGTLSEADLDRLRAGITVDGIEYQPMEITFDRQTGANSWFTVALREGKNREIRRVMEHLGVTVNRLIRISYGPFQLGDLPVGEVEEVKPRVVREQLGLAVPRPEPSRRRKGGTATGPAAEPAGGDTGEDSGTAGTTEAVRRPARPPSAARRPGCGPRSRPRPAPRLPPLRASRAADRRRRAPPGRDRGPGAKEDGPGPLRRLPGPAAPAANRASASPAGPGAGQPMPGPDRARAMRNRTATPRQLRGAGQSGRAGHPPARAQHPRPPAPPPQGPALADPADRNARAAAGPAAHPADRGHPAGGPAAGGPRAPARAERSRNSALPGTLMPSERGSFALAAPAALGENEAWCG